MHVHGADEAREGHLLEFVVDEVADGVGKGEAGWSGGEVGPVDRDGHLHGCSSFTSSGSKVVTGGE